MQNLKYLLTTVTSISTNPLGSESRLSPKLVKTMSSGVPVPSLGHLFPKLEYWWPFEALTKKCENTKHISKILLHGWQTWHNWFLNTKKYLVPAIFKREQSLLTLPNITFFFFLSLFCSFCLYFVLCFCLYFVFCVFQHFFCHTFCIMFAF